MLTKIVLLCVFIIVVLLSIAASFFLEAFCLWITTKIFKVENATYKKAMTVTVYVFLMAIVVGFIAGILSLAIKIEFLSDIITIIAIFFIANFFYKKYYQISTIKSIEIIIVSMLLSGVASFVIALLVVIPIRTYVMQPFFVQGDTMNPNFKNNQYLIINEFDKNYQRGDVVVFKYKQDPETFFIKRIVGLPNETVQIRENSVIINGQKLNESAYISSDVKTTVKDDLNIMLGNDEYFLLGDNREKSFDSRVYGPIKKDLITGKYWFAPFGF